MQTEMNTPRAPLPGPMRTGNGGGGTAEVERYLGRYLLDSRMLQAELRRRRRAEETRESGGVWDGAGESGVLFCRARMYEVQEFVTSLPDSREKLFLYQHYICGDSVPQIAEELGISDRSAYRLRHRALDLAALHYNRRPSANRFAAVRI